MLPGRPPRPDQIRRTIAIVGDDLGRSFESTVRAREALRRFLDTQVQPGDLVAILRTGAGMGALQQFTSDRRLLDAAVERIRWNLMSRVSAFASSTGEGGDRLDGFRDEIFSAGTQSPKDKGPFIAGGALQLGSTLPPGNYLLELAISDRLAKGARASQTMDFEVVE